jgi:hypothetical protein
VKRISDTNFLVICLTKASLTLCKILCQDAGGIALPVCKVSVLFADTQPHLRTSAFLSKIWVLLSDVPPCLRRADLLLEGTKMLGRPVAVDEVSVVAREGPIRMMFHSHVPAHHPKSVLLFANLRGSRIGLTVEGDKEIGPKPPGPEDKRKDEEGDKDNEHDQTEDQSQSDFHWKRQNSKAKDKMKDTGASGAPVGTTRALDPVESASPSLVDHSAPVFPSPPAAPKQGLHKVF